MQIGCLKIVIIYKNFLSVIQSSHLISVIHILSLYFDGERELQKINKI